jgi:hypothetical protein
MSSEVPVEKPEGSHTAEAEILQRELERRLELIDSAGDAEFGPFTPLDWTVVLLFFFILPLLIAWWGA